MATVWIRMGLRLSKGGNGNWWIATEIGASIAYRLQIGIIGMADSAGLSLEGKSLGLSVRCVGD